MSNIVKIQDLRSEEYIKEMNQVLTPEEKLELVSYIEDRGTPLSPDTAARFFELFLKGTNCYDIWKINKAFPYGAILDARIKFRWDQQKEEYALRLQADIKNKVAQAQLETADLMSDMLLAAKKLNSDKIKRYFQTGDEKELKDALKIESLRSLKEIVEGLMKITGQDKGSNITIKTEGNPKDAGGTPSTNGNLIASGVGIETLETEDAAAILEILAEANRRKNDDQNS
jgi:hypothetical protein